MSILSSTMLKRALLPLRLRLQLRPEVRGPWVKGFDYRAGASMNIRSLSSGSGSSYSRFSPTDHLYNMKPSLNYGDDKGKEDDDDDKNVDDFFEDSMLGDVDPSLRIGKVLFKAGRSKSKTSIPHPEWFRVKRDEICSYRSTAQIRRCLKSWMIDYDREYQKKFMSLPLKWRKDTPLGEKDAKATVVYGPEETVAYAHYFMGSRFSVLSVILSEVSNLLPDFNPTNIIDFGSGPGTAGAAAINVWPNKVEKYSGIDMSKSMLEAARVIIEGSNQNVGCVLWDKMGDAVKRAEAKHERFQLGFLTYTLSELGSDAAKQAAVQIMFELLDVGGVLVIVEDGNPRGSHLVRTARQFLLDNFMSSDNIVSNMGSKRSDTSKTSSSPVKSIDSDIQHILRPPNGYSHDDLSAKTIAPCTHDKPCPLKNMFCSFNQRVRSSMLRKDNEEKYSYVIIQKLGKGEKSVVRPPTDKIASVINEVGGNSVESRPNTWLKAPNQDMNQFMINEELGKRLKLLRQQRRNLAKENYLKALNEEGIETIDGNDDFAKVDGEIDESDDEESDSDSDYEDDEDDNNEADAIDETIFEAENDDDEEDDSLNDDDSDSVLDNGRTRKSKRSLFDENVSELTKHAMSKEEASRLTTRNILKQYIMASSSKDDVQNLNDYLSEIIDWDEFKPPLYRKEWGRVIRSPIKKKGHVIVDSCTSNGFISRSTFSKGNLSRLPSLYTALRKTTWGGLFPSSVRFDISESDDSLLKLKNKSNPKPGSFKFSKDYVAPSASSNADGREIKIDVNERMRELSSTPSPITSSRTNKNESDSVETLGRARRMVRRRGDSGVSISSLTSIDEADFDEVIGNTSSNRNRSSNSPSAKNDSKARIPNLSSSSETLNGQGEEGSSGGRSGGRSKRRN